MILSTYVESHPRSWSSRPSWGRAAMLEAGAGGKLAAMAVLRAFARPMLASIFIVQGYDMMRRPERVVKAAEPVVRPIADRVPIVPDDTEQAVRVNGAVQFIAGTLMATTAAGHRFWEATDEQERAQQRIHFMKNLAMFGGLLIAGADTAGRPSLAWRSRHALKSARRDLSRAAKTARKPGLATAKPKTKPKATAKAKTKPKAK